MMSHILFVLLAFASALLSSVHAGADPVDDVPTQDELNEAKDDSLWQTIGHILELEPEYAAYKQAGVGFVGQINSDNPLVDAINRMKDLRDRARDAGFSELHQNLKLQVRRLIRLERDVRREKEEAENEEGRITEAETETETDKQELYDALTVWADCLSSQGGSEGYFMFQGICYKLGSEEVGFDEARDLCQNVDMDLATVDTAEKDNFLIDVLNEHGLTAANDWPVYWFGGRKDANGAFRWISNNQLVDDGYTHWNTGEPNNSGGEEDCMHYWVFPTWNDARCTYVQRYICEFYRQ